MTKEEIDTMWQQAMRESIKDGMVYIRYHFAKLVAAKEREIQGAAFEKILESIRRNERAEEREACAVIAETPIIGEQDDITMEAKNRVAKAIRARG